MNVLLVMNENDQSKELRVVVTLSEKKLKEQVIALLEQDRGKEAFEIIKKKASVMEYLPKGKKPTVVPAVVLFEDML